MKSENLSDKEKITLVGFGWGSIGFLHYIDTNKYDVRLISNNKFFLYTPLLAQNINSNKQLQIDANEMNKKFTFIQKKVTDLDFDKRKIYCDDNSNETFDNLIFSHGSDVNTFNIPGVKEHTYFLKTQYDIDNMKKKINTLKDNSTIAVIGCGLSGSELIGTLNDMKKFNIIAVDALPRPLPMFNQKLSTYTTNLWLKENI